MSPDELSLKRRDLKQQAFHLRLNKAAGRLESPMKLRQTRRDLARLETVLREKRGAGPQAEVK